MTRTITICALVLRSSAQVIAGVAVSMLAALLIESEAVHLHNLAKLSTARSGNSGPWAMAWHLFTDFWWYKSILSKSFYLLTLLLVITTGLLEFTSTVLLSDLREGVLPGRWTTTSAYYDFEPVLRGEDTVINGVGRSTVWNRPPAAYPRFAEYHEPIPVTASSLSLDDTGKLFRAFLPMGNATQRQSLYRHTGPALVLDARVVCQRPQIKITRSIDNYMLEGTVQNSMNASDIWVMPGYNDFACEVPFNDSLSYSICQLAYYHNSYNVSRNQGGAFMGGLISSFHTHNTDALASLLSNKSGMIGDVPWGPAYIVMTSQLLESDVPQNHSTFVSDRQWLNFTDAAYPRTRISATLCFTAFDTAALNVSLYGDISLKSEPTVSISRTPCQDDKRDPAGYCPSRGRYKMHDVVDQLNPSNPPIARGLLALDKRKDWLPNPRYAPRNGSTPFVRGLSDMWGMQYIGDEFLSGWNGRIGQMISNRLQVSVFGSQTQYPDPAYKAVFNETMDKTGSAAQALSNLITLFSSTIYYEELEAFDRQGSIQTQVIESRNYPQANRGFIGVTVVIIANLVIVTVIFVLFALKSRLSLIGNSWANVAQIVEPMMRDFSSSARVEGDDDVRKELEKRGKANMKVQIADLMGSDIPKPSASL